MYIQDILYGLIKVPDLCKSFIDTPEFQRLKRIKQVGMVSEVFPSATHTRAEHCIGVMHLSGLFLTKLLANSDKKWAEYKKYITLIELAGLLHDIGHGPLSHLFEEAMYLRNIKFCHEQHSIYILNKINNRIGALNEIELELVANIILGKKIDGYPDFLFDIVANHKSGLDTDKMDYLRRDAFHVGCTIISIDYIINHMKIDKYECISYAEKTESNIRNVFATRKAMFKQVYYHKTNIKLDKMMICAICQLNLDIENPDCFLELDDYVLDYKLRYELKHDCIRCLNERRFNHSCDKCPNVKLIRVAKLSGDTDDPMSFVRFYNDE